ncbi:hypothetical protein EVAR_100850_1 [Eumeta japonica]|uniref:Uncharacterized protein n=1 Tax=Eumeta variegata TaxID=151549 RepID=A0A4C1T1N6_EUMVA|nr:hypothetical protein EVAR_100850_1 [Eumeta japonica]
MKIENKTHARSGTKRDPCPCLSSPNGTINHKPAIKNNSEEKKKVESTNILPNTDLGFNYSRLKATVENLVQTINNFTTTMTSMMQEMLRIQSLDVISNGEPTHWLSDRQKIPDVIDLSVTKNISRELVDVEASLHLSSDHSPTIVSIRIPQKYELPFTHMNVISRINWLRFKKYLSSHCLESIQLRTPGDVGLSIENFTKVMNQAVKYASTTYQQPSFNRVFSTDIQHLVNEKSKKRVAAKQISPA